MGILALVVPPEAIELRRSLSDPSPPYQNINNFLALRKKLRMSEQLN
jgi:hypothetical protein